MAALSNAFGEVSVQIRTPGYEIDFEDFWKALLETQKGEQSFDAVDEESLFTDSFKFYGAGRWEFAENLEFFGLWAHQTLNATKNLVAKSYLELLDFTLTFNYNDYEPSAPLLRVETDVVAHRANTPLTMADYEMVSRKEYVPCSYNLIKLGFYEDLCDWLSDTYDYTMAGKKIILTSVRSFNHFKNDLRKSFIECHKEHPALTTRELQINLLEYFSVLDGLECDRERINLLEQVNNYCKACMATSK